MHRIGGGSQAGTLLLYLHPTIGDFTVWKWVHGINPAPGSLLWSMMGFQFSSEFDNDFEDFDVVMEAVMYPPNVSEVVPRCD